MQFGSINGLDKKISKLILGNDKQKKYSSAVKLWDCFYENGGNVFDNSIYYRNGESEKFLGKWIKSRDIENNVVIISKVGEESSDPSEISSLINLNLNIIFFIILLLSIFLFPFIRNRIFKNIIIFLIILLFVLLSYYSNILLSWFMPIIVIIIHLFIVNFNKISSYLIEKKIINILSIIFTLFFINSLSSKVSDLDILNKESKFLENSILIGPKTLKENGNFVNYSKFLKTYKKASSLQSPPLLLKGLDTSFLLHTTSFSIAILSVKPSLLKSKEVEIQDLSAILNIF